MEYSHMVEVLYAPWATKHGAYYESKYPQVTHADKLKAYLSQDLKMFKTLKKEAYGASV